MSVLGALSSGLIPHEGEESVMFLLRGAVVGSLAVLLLAIVGCKESGPTVYPVTGKVTMDNKPLTDVRVEFYPVDNDSTKHASGNVDEQGVYTLRSGAEGKEGAQPGKYKVYLSPVAAEVTEGGTYGNQQGGPGGQSSGPPMPKLTFPQQWSQPASTPLEVEVKEQSNTIDIEVK
jgi:hypothetical protein